MFAILTEILTTLLLVFYYLIQGVILAILPKQWFKKSVKRENVLITGAGSGLGRLLSYKFAALGANLVLLDINEKSNETTAETCRSLYNIQTHTYVVDLCNKMDIYDTAEKIKRDVGNVDIVVNNAGIVTGKKFLDCPDDMIQKTMEVNVMAHFWIAKCFLPSMMLRNHGHIVTLASAAGINGTTGLVDYCASKFAAVGFDESLRYELQKLGKDGVHTTVICPYTINTGMFDGVTTRFPSILPILEPEFVTNTIMDAILTNEEVCYIPRMLIAFFSLRGILPTKCQFMIAELFGINKQMDSFRGRANQQQTTQL